MLNTASIRAFETQMRVYTDRTLPDLARQTMARAATETVARVEREQRARSGGITPAYTPIVDGMRGAPFSAVKPDGQIILDWNYLTEAVNRTVLHLRTHGPELTGNWRRSILVEVDGAIYQPGQRLPAAAKIAYVGVNTPYSRRLEIGNRPGGGPFVVQVPQHFVEQTALLLRREMRDLAVVKFTMQPFIGANKRVTRKELRDARVPAIMLQEIQAL